jgi:hypothetical protein
MKTLRIAVSCSLLSDASGDLYHRQTQIISLIHPGDFQSLTPLLFDV